MSMWNHHDTNLDEYPAVIRQNAFYALECVDAQGHVRIGPPELCNGHWYDSYPIGGTVLTAPLIVAAVDVMKLMHPLLAHFHSSQPVVEGFLNGDYDTAHQLIEMEVASFLLALTAVMMYVIARRFLPVKRSILLALLFALATSAYSIAGRAVWQHTPSMLLLTIVIYMLLRAAPNTPNSHPSLAAWAGLPVALAYTVRPTDSLFVIIFTLYVAVRHRKYLVYYLLAAAPVAAAFLAYNLSVYHNILSPYYHSDLLGFYPRNWPRMAMAMAGNLISPRPRPAHFHPGLHLCDRRHAAQEMENAAIAMACRAGACTLDRRVSLHQQLVGRPFLRSALLHRHRADLRAIPDPLVRALGNAFAIHPDRVRHPSADRLRDSPARRLVARGNAMECGSGQYR